MGGKKKKSFLNVSWGTHRNECRKTIFAILFWVQLYRKWIQSFFLLGHCDTGWNIKFLLSRVSSLLMCTKWCCATGGDVVFNMLNSWQASCSFLLSLASHPPCLPPLGPFREPLGLRHLLRSGLKVCNMAGQVNLILQGFRPTGSAGGTAYQLPHFTKQVLLSTVQGKA